jgi:catalase-peroxidase
MDAKTGDSMGCPVDRPTNAHSLLGRTNRDWWPDALPIDILHQGGVSPDPMGDDFDYADAFNALDYQALKRDLTALMTDSQPWWRRLRTLRPVLHSDGLTLQEPIGPRTVARCEQRPTRFAQLAAGRTTATSTRHGGCCGQSAEVQEEHQLGRPLHLAGTAIGSMGGPIFGFGGRRPDVFELGATFTGAPRRNGSTRLRDPHPARREMDLENPPPQSRWA